VLTSVRLASSESLRSQRGLAKRGWSTSSRLSTCVLWCWQYLNQDGRFMGGESA